MTYCLDTNTCIYFLKGTYPLLQSKMLSLNPNDIKIPAIVKAELLHGAEKSQKREENAEKVLMFLLPFEIIPFDSAASVLYAEIRAKLERKGEVIGPYDLLIAATALAANNILVTNNTKEFRRVEGLQVENWTTSV